MQTQCFIATHVFTNYLTSAKIRFRLRGRSYRLLLSSVCSNFIILYRFILQEILVHLSNPLSHTHPFIYLTDHLFLSDTHFANHGLFTTFR